MKDDIKGKGFTRKFTENFLVGGTLVAFALWVSYFTSPVVGGIIAALPIRLSITWILAGLREGKEFAAEMARGSIVGMIGNLCFTLTLLITIIALGIGMSFLLALVICGVIIVALNGLSTRF
jgi:hypothetical protein